jgi:hemerythrin-like metal-binding protein
MLKKIKPLLHDIGNKLSIMNITNELLSTYLESENEELSKEKIKKISKRLKSSTVYVIDLFNELTVITKQEDVIKDTKLTDLMSLYTCMIDEHPEVKIQDKVFPHIWININRSDFRRVIENCIGNSLKSGATEIIISHKIYGKALEIQLIDNGNGMTKEELKQIGFGYSTSGGGQGTDIVRTIIRNHHGVIEWEQNELNGITCNIRIPRFVWEKEIAVGHDRIDQEHIAIFSILHQLEYSSGDKTNLLNMLLEVLVTHTTGEEAEMEEQNYPHLKRDKKAHREIDKKATRLRDKYNEYTDNEKNIEILKIRDLILTHFNTLDVEYNNFLLSLSK